MDVGGVEVIGFDRTAQQYWSQFFDSQGNAMASSLTVQGERWIWQGENTRCTVDLSADGKTQVAHHERRDDTGRWLPSMEVVLTKVE